MHEFTMALIGIVSLAIWIFIGRMILKEPVAKPHQFAAWMSVWLGFTEFVMVFLREGLEIKSIILGMILLMGTTLIGYPIAYFSYKFLRK